MVAGFWSAKQLQPSSKYMQSQQDCDYIRILKYYKWKVFTRALAPYVEASPWMEEGWKNKLLFLFSEAELKDTFMVSRKKGEWSNVMPDLCQCFCLYLAVLVPVSLPVPGKHSPCSGNGRNRNSVKELAASNRTFPRLLTNNDSQESLGEAKDNENDIQYMWYIHNRDRV